MVKYPYTQNLKNVGPLFNKIHEVGTPDKVSNDWIYKAGFKSSNDKRLMPLLQFLGFIDSTKKPTDRWQEYRDLKQSKIVLAKAIQEGYSDLYDFYPNAHNQSDEDLESFFGRDIDASQKVRKLTLTTYKTLCNLADFHSEPMETPVPSEPTPPESSIGAPTVDNKIIGKIQPVPQININIQLTLPEKTDPDTYDKFFAAMKKHLYPEDKKDG